MGDLHPGIARSIQPAIPPVNHPYAAVLRRPCGRKPARGIGRPVVNNDDFKIAVRLFNQALHAPVEPLLRVVRRDHHGNERRGLGGQTLRVNTPADDLLPRTCEGGRNERLLVGLEHVEQIAIGAQPFGAKHKVRHMDRSIVLHPACDVRLPVFCRIHQHFKGVIVYVPVIVPDDRDIFLDDSIEHGLRDVIGIDNLAVGDRRLFNMFLETLQAATLPLRDHDQGHTRKALPHLQLLPVPIELDHPLAHVRRLPQGKRRVGVRSPDHLEGVRHDVVADFRWLNRGKEDVTFKKRLQRVKQHGIRALVLGQDVQRPREAIHRSQRNAPAMLFQQAAPGQLPGEKAPGLDNGKRRPVVVGLQIPVRPHAVVVQELVHDGNAGGDRQRQASETDVVRPFDLLKLQAVPTHQIRPDQPVPGRIAEVREDFFLEGLSVKGHTHARRQRRRVFAENLPVRVITRPIPPKHHIGIVCFRFAVCPLEKRRFAPVV